MNVVIGMGTISNDRFINYPFMFYSHELRSTFTYTMEQHVNQLCMIDQVQPFHLVYK